MFGLRAIGGIEALCTGTNGNSFLIHDEEGDFVVKESTAYRSRRAAGRSARIYEALARRGVATKQLRQTQRDRSTTYFCAARNTYWECSRYIDGVPFSGAAGQVRALGQAVGRLHAALGEIDREVPLTTQQRYWRLLAPVELRGWLLALEGLHPPAITSGERRVLERGVTFAAGLRPAPRTAMHGDLHLDNVLFVSAQPVAYIFDFDVARSERNGQATDLGVLLHRLVRAIMLRSPERDLRTVVRRVARDLVDPYATASEPPSSQHMLRSAALESLRKVAAALARSRSSREPWARYASFHLRYLDEILEMSRAIRTAPGEANA